MWNLPNLLTLARIVAIVPLVAFIDLGWWVAAFALFAAAAATDWLDGFLARRWNQQSDLGRMLDPIADKLIVAAVLVALLPIRTNSETGSLGISIWVVIAIIAREILVSGLREYLGPSGTVVHVSALAKWKTATQLLAIGTLLAAPAIAPAAAWSSFVAVRVGAVGAVLLLVSALLAWLTAFTYLRAGLRHMEARA